MGTLGVRELRSQEMRPALAAPGLSPPHPRDKSPAATTCRGAEQHAGNCSAFTPSKVARRKLSISNPRRALPGAWVTEPSDTSGRGFGSASAATDPDRAGAGASSCRSELLALATHHPAARAQPAVGSARPADWGGDRRVCPRFDFAWCTPRRRQAGYFSSDEKERANQ